ncbi:GFA family protein [Rhizobium tubonense]|uniref:Aldehyde-activating protein n=1 Tax=Rhizobium tubonense TaxID=484088 RepID=A0A2W4F9E0_9HYPH|nr:GFA family protein [Rhizobium tubonense]PZM17250.1 aldehyde-activating protein [Rhizobium tubonense]
MSELYTGGCACGAIRYRIAGDPLVMLDCQCRQCQRESGTGHASHLTFKCEDVAVEGEAAHWELVGDGGLVKKRSFCPTCGSPVYMTFPGMPDYFVVRAGSLDEPARYRPQMISWTASSQAWDHVDPLLPKFDKMPPI